MVLAVLLVRQLQKAKLDAETPTKDSRRAASAAFAGVLANLMKNSSSKAFFRNWGRQCNLYKYVCRLSCLQNKS